jgi:hypothetical protein
MLVTYLVPEVRICPHLAADLVFLRIFEAAPKILGQERI